MDSFVNKCKKAAGSALEVAQLENLQRRGNSNEPKQESSSAADEQHKQRDKYNDLH